MAVVLLLLAISISFIVVRMGAVMLEMTGVPWEHAKFQALSAFTNAGFTTRESEQITRHPLRRRIATVLIVLGNAGLITTVGSFATSLAQPQPARAIVNLFSIILGIALLGWIAHRPQVTQLLYRHTRRWLSRRYPIESWAPDEILHLDRGYVLTKFVLSSRSRAVGQTLRRLRLKQNRVQVLAVERGHAFEAVPDGEYRLKAGDEVIVYGVRESVESLLQPGEDQTFLLVEDPPVDLDAGPAEQAGASTA